MPIQEVKHTVQADGRIVLEGLSLRRGQQVRVLLETDDAGEPPRKPTYEEIMANRKRMKGSITFADDYDPAEPACDPSEWDANRG